MFFDKRQPDVGCIRKKFWLCIVLAWVSDGPSSPISALQAQVNGILARYLRSLLHQQQHALIPVYACRLQLEARRHLCVDFLSQLTRQNDEEVHSSAWFFCAPSTVAHISCQWQGLQVGGPWFLQHKLVQVSSWWNHISVQGSLIYSCYSYKYNSERFLDNNTM